MFAQDRHRRGRHRPDAAVDRRQLRHAQAARANGPIPKRPKRDLVAEIEKAAEEIPGSNYELSQPIQLRFNELISGVRSDVGVKIFGDDLDTLVAGRRPGAGRPADDTGRRRREDRAGRRAAGADREAQPRGARRATASASPTCRSIVEIAVGGKNAGHVFEGDRRFDLVVRLPEHLRLDIEAIKALPIPLPNRRRRRRRRSARCGATRRWRRCATRRCPRSRRSRSRRGPNQISRENGKRRIVVSANVRGRDLGSFVADAQQQIAEKVKLPAGYWIGWGGQFEQLVSATKRLTIVVPIALLLIFLLLFMSLGSAADALLVFSGVPLALTGGIAALLLRDIPLSISAGIGFIALSGVAVLNGLVIIAFIQKLRDEGRAAGRGRARRRADAAAAGADDRAGRLARLRPDGDRDRRRAPRCSARSPPS